MSLINFSLIFIYPIIVYSIYEKCKYQDRITRPCISEGLVCGYSNSFFPLQTYSSKCEACQTNEIQFISRSACIKGFLLAKVVSPNPIKKPEFYYKCKIIDRKNECINSKFFISCGYDVNWNVIKNYESICQACRNKTVRYVSFGDCIEIYKKINNKIKKPSYLEDCSNDQENNLLGPVCGTDVNFIEKKTFNSKAEACGNKEIKFFFYGMCRFFQLENGINGKGNDNGKRRPKIDYACKNSDKLRACHNENLQMCCGYDRKFDQVGDFSSLCLACASPLVKFVRFGTCF